jgi:hypothetical protein
LRDHQEVTYLSATDFDDIEAIKRDLMRGGTSCIIILLELPEMVESNCFAGRRLNAAACHLSRPLSISTQPQQQLLKTTFAT